MAALNSKFLSGRIYIRTPRTKVEHGLLIPRTSSKLVASSLSSVKTSLKNCLNPWLTISELAPSLIAKAISSA
ncbi:hypothetical protein GBA52_015408 [Prunus armeniaca]|nr:hypothetical protein GBA52_015408 [Prunus armeniaca]